MGAHAGNDGVDVIDGEHDGMPGVFTGASTGPNLVALGLWNLSSSIPCPSGVRIIARVARTSLSPIKIPTAGLRLSSRPRA